MSLTRGTVYTNHNDAFTKALQLFSPTSTNAKVMIMFTDGRTTIGGDASPVAKQAKEQGVTIYCIGLSGNGGIDTQALIDWASNPASAYVVITPSDEELETIFSDLAQNISKPGAKDIIIRDVVSSCFKIISFDSPTKGSASLLNETTLQWKIDELGTKASEGASLEFTVKHIGSCSGTVEVNNYVSYEDKDLNIVSFPSPKREINCGDAIEFDGGDINLESLGRILQLDVTIKNVCPNRRVVLPWQLLSLKLIAMA